MTHSLYRDVILDHYRNPRNHGTLPHATHRGSRKNPSCGDHLSIDMTVRNDTIEDVRFSGAGCAISQASASLLTERVKGLGVDAVRTLRPEDVFALLGVTLSPARVKCALLALETIQDALNN
jgi:nitrogen fixation protein NifU and related proteins